MTPMTTKKTLTAEREEIEAGRKEFAELKQRIRTLQRQLNSRTVVAHGVKWVRVETGELDAGPYCPKCQNLTQLLPRRLSEGCETKFLTCPVCEHPSPFAAVEVDRIRHVVMEDIAES
jgi:hypothetical protein